jgi:hypothetical protein
LSGCLIQQAFNIFFNKLPQNPWCRGWQAYLNQLTVTIKHLPGAKNEWCDYFPTAIALISFAHDHSRPDFIKTGQPITILSLTHDHTNCHSIVIILLIGWIEHP